MTNYKDLIARLEAGYTKPLSTPPEFAEAAAAIRELLDELENEQARDIHSCGPTCSKSGCVNRRLREQCDELLAALEAGHSSLHVLPGGKDCKCSQCEFVGLRRSAIASVKGGAA